MSVADLLRTPKSPAEVADWTFQHDQDHKLIREIVRQRFSIDLPTYALDPFNPSDPGRWLYDHQTAHTDFDAVLGIQSSDLNDVDFKSTVEADAWIWANYIEHQQAHAILEI